MMRRPTDVDGLLAELCWTSTRPTSTDVGVELELFPFVLTSNGGTRRASLAETWPRLSAALGLPTEVYTAPVRLPDGGMLSFEPGGQIEYSTPPCATAAAAMKHVTDGVSLVAAVLAPDVVLVPLGLDQWHCLDDVPQQLAATRYQAMAAYFASSNGEGEAGALMMRQTCSYQINMNFRPGREADVQWLLACLLAPLAGALFGTSPGPAGCPSARASVWRGLHTRSGSMLRDPHDLDETPLRLLTRAVLNADVLLFRRPSGTVCGSRGFTFERWLAEGHPDYGPPSADDLAYHLTTLWHDVRARGFLEIRTLDALPLRWASAPIALFSGLLYHPAATEEALCLLRNACRTDWDWWMRLRLRGPDSPEGWALASELWRIALTGLRELPVSFMDPEDVERAEDYAERFTHRRCFPADELRAQGVQARDAVRWATLPSYQMA